MADNYTQFSAYLCEDASPDEVAWLRKTYNDLADSDEPPGFSIRIDGEEVWVYSDEFGSPDALIDFAGGFISKFRPEMVFAFTWADTCSKPRIGEFGGGYAVVTADRIEGGTTYDMATAWAQDLEGGGGARREVIDWLLSVMKSADVEKRTLVMEKILMGVPSSLIAGALRDVMFARPEEK